MLRYKMSAKTRRLIDNIRQREQNFSFLNKYIVRSGKKTYCFTGFNCSLEPCFQFEQDDQITTYYYDRGGWETADQTGVPNAYYNSFSFNRPKKYLAPEINYLVKVYNDHILEEIKYLSWKIFIVDKRKTKEFKLVVLCFGRVGVRLPPEIIFYILSFLKGWELLFETEIVDVDNNNPTFPFRLDYGQFPKLNHLFQIIE